MVTTNFPSCFEEMNYLLLIFVRKRCKESPEMDMSELAECILR